ncbi:MAG: hypothetical protein U9R75_11490, partial [Candidatus Thermoplasmatota archaeon]|nr:hypothetical protein [Candidatus Thermoplasmatota archaeon]
SVEGPSPPSVFVGRFGYPRITVGPITAPFDIPLPERLGSSRFMFDRSMEEVYSIRSSLVRGKYRLDARISKDPGVMGSEPIVHLEENLPIRGRKILSSIQELALSARSLDTEMSVSTDGRREPERPNVDSITMPMGPSVNIIKVNINDNPKVPNAVEKAASDTDLDASKATADLFNSGIEAQHLVRLFSVGLLGEKKRRRMVPTRWTITAVDDILSKDIKRRVIQNEPLERYLLYSGEHYGNHFLIALFPPPFRFEMLEQWQNDSLWGNSPVIHDHEGPRGRKDYASSITGAYYAARLSVLQHLERTSRNSGISVIRWITGDYWVPLGVWVIRETVRRAMLDPPEIYETMEGLLKRIDQLSGMKNWRSRTSYLTRDRMTTLDEFT